MTPERLVPLVTAALETLGVADRVSVGTVERRDDTAWHVTLTMDERQAAISVDDVEDDRALGKAIRGELRRALRMCPLCQRIGHVEKIRDAAGQQEACAVRCPACGDYEIEQALIREFRSAWERGDAGVLARLPAIAEQLRERAPAERRLRAADWKG